MDRRFLSDIGERDARIHASSRLHKHTDMREFTRFDGLAEVSAIDAEARVVHSRLSINTRGSRKTSRVIVALFTLYLSFSLNVLFCT